MSFEGCCGQPRSSRRRVRPTAEPLPQNPPVKAGVAVVYLGSGRREVIGAASGLRYVVDDHRRHFRVEPKDADVLLRDREFILKV